MTWPQASIIIGGKEICIQNCGCRYVIMFGLYGCRGCAVRSRMKFSLNASLAGYVISMDSEGETALIPSEIMHYSIQQASSGQVNVETTLKLLASPTLQLVDIPGAEESSDHVVR
jgi:hypothetical protein